CRSPMERPGRIKPTQCWPVTGHRLIAIQSFPLHIPISEKMRQHAFVMIRYSILSDNIGIGWVLGRDDDFENYRANLFAADRMEARQDLFERITLPSLVNQTKCPSSDWLTVFVMVSEEMPA